ncbi:PDR/VanB family oxidoreductase [Ammoniphilus sp. CFH 90114]|uniref:PDR/VanB family oxidoreductase n=1 Tax=Ammoniphilus sp. CFH 90114 TaxID=2493665 RepID=UPI00100DB536|nr:PDR/VanB family oxidoreductase [Ammoniphilus sp. CFH 90114]RXT04277.1 oxidoreductase [Ammoniphilus sp. CFH 90114]
MANRIKVKVKEVILECPGVKRFTLVSLDGQPLPGFSGGSHLTVVLPGKSDTLELERHYSLVSSPLQQEEYQIAVRLTDPSSGGSKYMHEQVQKGDLLEVSWPKNHFPLSFRAKHHVFYAAGIGITPFLSMMAELKATGQSFELHYGAKEKSECPFYGQLSSQYRDLTTFYFSRDGRRMSPMTLLDHRIGTHIYICGPETMIEEFIDAATSYGYPKSSIHFERFTPPRPKTTHSFQVDLAKTGFMVDIPEDQSILEVLLKHGVKASYSCKVGGCGTCEVKVIEGEVDHQDSFLSDEFKREGQVMLPCVSRAKGKKLVIDL